MIDIPKNHANGIFDNELKRGSVVKTLFRCSDGQDRPKYFIILNCDVSKDPIIFVLTTSQLDFFKKHPQFNKDIIRIKPAAIKLFPNETIINCREVYRISKDILKINFQKDRLKFIGDLTTDILVTIDGIILHSYFIPNGDKRLILGNKINSPENPLPIDNPRP